MKMYFIKIENLTDYECNNSSFHYNDYTIAQQSLKDFIEECEEEYDDYRILFGESHWRNGVLIDDWVEAKTIEITH